MLQMTGFLMRTTLCAQPMPATTTAQQCKPLPVLSTAEEVGGAGRTIRESCPRHRPQRLSTATIANAGSLGAAQAQPRGAHPRCPFQVRVGVSLILTLTHSFARAQPRGARPRCPCWSARTACGRSARRGRRRGTPRSRPPARAAGCSAPPSASASCPLSAPARARPTRLTSALLCQGGRFSVVSCTLGSCGSSLCSRLQQCCHVRHPGTHRQHLL